MKSNLIKMCREIGITVLFLVTAAWTINNQKKYTVHLLGDTANACLGHIGDTLKAELPDYRWEFVPPNQDADLVIASLSYDGVGRAVMVRHRDHLVIIDEADVKSASDIDAFGLNVAVSAALKLPTPTPE